MRERIVAARDAVRSAELRLNDAITEQGGGGRAEKVEANITLLAALSNLRAARAEVDHLEEAVAGANVDAARRSVLEMRGVLDRAIRGLRPGPRVEKAWVSAPVESALAAARAARQHASELEEALKARG